MVAVPPVDGDLQPPAEDVAALVAMPIGSGHRITHQRAREWAPERLWVLRVRHLARPPARNCATAPSRGSPIHVPCAARTASFTVSPHFAACVISACSQTERPHECEDASTTLTSFWGGASTVKFRGMAWDVPCAARTASFTVSPHFAAGVISALPPNARPRRPRMALRGGVHQFLVTLSQPNRFGRVASNGRLAAVCTDQGRCAPPSTKRHAPRRSSHTATPATSPTYHQRSYPGIGSGSHSNHPDL